MSENIEALRKQCSVFGNYLPEDKRLCGRCELKLKEACMVHTQKNGSSF